MQHSCRSLVCSTCSVACEGAASLARLHWWVRSADRSGEGTYCLYREELQKLSVHHKVYRIFLCCQGSDNIRYQAALPGVCNVTANLLVYSLDLLPAALVVEPGGELHYGRHRQGKVPDFMFLLSTLEGPVERLAKLIVICTVCHLTTVLSFTLYSTVT